MSDMGISFAVLGAVVVLFLWNRIPVELVAGAQRPAGLQRPCPHAGPLTPVATPANLMVMGPGGYRFGDYWTLGLPLLVMFVLVGTFVLPLFWPF